MRSMPVAAGPPAGHQALDAPALGRVVRAYRDALEAHRESINSLNVYPVPDGDTGTNMALTLQSVCAELDAASGGATAALDMAATCVAMSHGSLMGARGNSGVILSQVMRGLAEVFREHDEVDGPTLAQALAAAAKGAYEAVMRPVEGTILTVVREAAEAAEHRVGTEGSALVEVAESARAAAAEALARTPELLAVLRRAGVVDAGGAGFVLLLDALLHVLDGRPVPAAAPVSTAGPREPTDSGRTDEATMSVGAEDPRASGPRYEVMYFLAAPDESVPAFKDVWVGVGDSIVVVGGDGLWNCHIHTDDIGAAIEAALDCGRPRDIRVTDLLEQVEEERWVRDAAAASVERPAQADQPVRTAVVAVSAGAGIGRILYSLGVQRIVPGGQSMNPSTAQLLEAVEAAPAAEVVILPNNTNIVGVAEQVGAQTDKSVRVVPTRGITEGFAALLAYDPAQDVEANAREMGGAAGSVVAGEVTRAVRDASCDAGPIRKGDYIGIARGAGGDGHDHGEGIRSVSASASGAALGLLASLVAEDHEVVTVIEGEGSSAADTRRITEWLHEHRPHVSTDVHRGGQPLYPYLFGVE